LFDKYFKKNIYDINKIAFLYSFGKIMSKKNIPTIRKSIKQKIETTNNDIKIDIKAADTKIVSEKKEIIIKKRVVEPLSESVSTNKSSSNNSNSSNSNNSNSNSSNSNSSSNSSNSSNNSNSNSSNNSNNNSSNNSNNNSNSNSNSNSSEIYFIEPSDLPRDRKSPGILNYNDNLYSLLYTDLRDLSPKERGVHYLEKGIYEGRIATYRQLFSKIGPELYYHFDHKQYLKAYEDLQEIYTEKDRYALILHYINNGVSEMRKEFRSKNKLIPLINYWDSDDSEDESEE